MLSPVGVRSHLQIPRETAYLNTAATSPTPDYVRDAMRVFEEDRATRAEEGWDDWIRNVDAARESTAHFFRARPEEVAFLSNTGHGLNTVANMFPWKRGDEIVTSDLEFPSNLLPWRRLEAIGVKVHVVASSDARLNVDALMSAINDRTRLVTTSWVSYRNGQRLPLRDIADAAHRHGAYLLVDAIQGAGALQPDFRRHGIDFLASGGHKWLMAPFGIGAFLVRRDLLGEFEPPSIGWFSLEEPDDFEATNTTLASTARRFEVGNLNFGGVAGWKAALDAFVGLGGFDRAALDNARTLMEGADAAGLRVVTPREREEHAAIVCFALDRPKECVEWLREQSILVSLRDNWVRASPHFWNSKEDLDRLLAALARWSNPASRPAVAKRETRVTLARAKR